MGRIPSTRETIVSTKRGCCLAQLTYVFVLLACCACDTQPHRLQHNDEPITNAAGPSVETSSHRWATRLRSGDGVSLINEYGDLRARQSGDSGLHYAAIVQKLDGEDRDAQFETHRLPEKLQIEVTSPPDWYGRVDASARVPAGSPLDLRTAAGLIEVRTGDNDVLALSPDGRISIRTSGRIRARGQTGDMLIVMLGTEYGDDEAGRIETTRGNVELWLQPDANITLHTSAGGGVDIDVADTGVVVEKTDNDAQVSFGDGDARLDVHTMEGALIVRTLPVVQ